MTTKKLIAELDECSDKLHRAARVAETLKANQPLVVDHEDLLLMRKALKSIKLGVLDLEDLENPI